ncbi:MAG: hypothetical protein H5U26_04270 [Immundisolibacter sp.]|uniref:hypothetical protein n=1 Tax=Immundisolibacter sp. TaxID=1934948 RepID=UPI0019849BE4|nr:hypothetical protein [Immundisolibacter sp.]MBC7161307.1 hypothetical protein [Immundisolibacter sp.]
MFLSRASCVAVLLLLAGHALAQDGGLIDRVQMGDNDLDCAQIAGQVRELEALLAPHSGDPGAVRGATETVTRSRTGEVVAGVAKVLPFGSIFGDIAKDVLGRRGRDSEARIASARARKEYLVDMFLKRGCRVADVAAGKAKPDAPASAVDPAADATGASATTAPAPAQPALPVGAPLSTEAVVAAAPEAAPAARPEAAEKPAQSPRGPLFMLDFRLAFRTRADADGPAGAPGLELGGVPLTTMQAITDAAYVALLKELQQAGFEVLNPELASLPTGGSLPAPARAGDYLYFAPSGAPLAQAPTADAPGSDAALAETRAALARAVAGRRPGVSYGIAVWYVDFARVSGAAGGDQPRQLESRLAVVAGSHLALVEPAAGDGTPPDAVRVMNLGRDLVSREPYGQVRLSGSAVALELKADPQRFRSLVERQLKRGRSALIASLPAPLPAPATAPPTEPSTAPVTPPAAPAAAVPH